MTTTALGQMNPCPHCSNPPYNYVYHHGGVCPKIKEDKMLVKIPKEIKVAARNYAIILDRKFIRDTGDRGQCTFHRQRIELDGNMQGDVLNVTFLHELTHLFDEHFCGRAGLSESTTCGIAEGLYQFLKDNLGLEFIWDDIEVKDE